MYPDPLCGHISNETIFRDGNHTIVTIVSVIEPSLYDLENMTRTRTSVLVHTTAVILLAFETCLISSFRVIENARSNSSIAFATMPGFCVAIAAACSSALSFKNLLCSGVRTNLVLVGSVDGCAVRFGFDFALDLAIFAIDAN